MCVARVCVVGHIEQRAAETSGPFGFMAVAVRTFRHVTDDENLDVFNINV